MATDSKETTLAAADTRRGRELFLVFIVIAAVGIVTCLGYFVFWLIDNQNTLENTATVVESANLSQVEAGDTSGENSDDEDKFDPYWDFGDTNYLAADFDGLRQINPEIVAWISVGGTSINYPIAQHSDNDFYLNHSIDRSKNDAGWVFMDYRNRGALSTAGADYDRNTIIYAHGRHDGSMFGSLKNVLGANWHKDSDNFLIKISTPKSNSIWRIFSTYKIPDTNDYIQTSFSSNSDFENFLQMLKSRSNFDYHTDLTANDKIITLSTCSTANPSDRIVAHAKLIRSQNR